MCVCVPDPVPVCGGSGRGGDASGREDSPRRPEDRDQRRGRATLRVVSVRHQCSVGLQLCREDFTRTSLAINTTFTAEVQVLEE